MPRFDIVRNSIIPKSFRTEFVRGQFDLKIGESVEETFSGDIELPDEWSVGVICGASGTGKTTIAKEIFPEEYIGTHDYGNRPVIDEMPEDIDTTTICKTFNSVGFATCWSWLKPYHVLSEGEKMRVNLAQSLLQDRELIVFDEYTSTINREVAKVASFAISKAVRKTKKRFVAVTCHQDVVDWLEPDWIFNTDSMSFFLPKTKGQALNSESMKRQFQCGKFLRSIII